MKAAALTFYPFSAFATLAARTYATGQIHGKRPL